MFVTWFGFAGQALATQAWLAWDWHKVVITIGLFVGIAVGLGIAMLLRPVLQPHEPSWTIACASAFVGIPLILGVAELLRGDTRGGWGTITWYVPIAAVAGVVVGRLARRFRTTR
ncbi:MAG: hypothetical protein ACE5E6_07215 [Phycisphaerae bacterium]